MMGRIKGKIKGGFLLPITSRAPFGDAFDPNRDDWALVRVLH